MAGFAIPSGMPEERSNALMMYQSFKFAAGWPNIAEGATAERLGGGWAYGLGFGALGEEPNKDIMAVSWYRAP